MFVWVADRMTAQPDEHCSQIPSDQIWLKSSWKNFLNAPVAFNQNNGDDTLILKAAPRLPLCGLAHQKLLSRTDYMFSQQVQSNVLILFIYVGHRAACKHIDFPC